MIIAIDYDKTFTADPDYFREFIRLGESRGHQFLCVTGRNEPPGDHEVQPEIPFVLCEDELKSIVCKRQGFNVDIWIDDFPGTIEGQRILQWPEQQVGTPSETEILNDPSASGWLKNQLLQTRERDPVDSLNDGEILVELLKKRLTEITAIKL